MDKMISLIIDGKELTGLPGQTIYQVASKNGIKIPTLCHDERLKPFASCWICLVEVEGARGFVPSCSSEIRPGMKVTTDSEKIRSARKLCLELLLSNHPGDCVAPCQLRCPAGVDVQGFIAHIARGDYQNASKLHKEKNPFPLVCGRVCPRTCEESCRRNHVDEPVAIAWLKRFFADRDLELYGGYRPVPKSSTGKKVAIIGAGPAGLTAAYYLSEKGHSCEIFEKLPDAGGMLRYGIPAYRLPREILEKEIACITDMGVRIRFEQELGRDFTIASLKNSGFDAVLTATGAHRGSAMKISGENSEGVVNGIDFLREVSMNEKYHTGKRVGVIGGGNTAIDAARTSLRLGALEVYLIYRRTREEMPAWSVEIHEAELEGVKMMFLTAPLEVISDNKKMTALRCQKMVSGEPDESGRRRPVPLAGSEFDIELDTCIAAIGQTPDLNCYLADQDMLDYTRWGTVKACPDTGRTKTDFVFAAGDLVSGPATAVEAIASGRRAALAVDSFLRGALHTVEKSFSIRREDLKDIDESDFAQYEKKKRVEMTSVEISDRIKSFMEVENGLFEKSAAEEADRCLACGCSDAFECRLREYSRDYEASAKKFLGKVQNHPIDSSHPYIVRDQNKCIMCARCIRTCLEIRGIGALGFVYRGFDVEVAPALKKSLSDTECDSCGQCVSACPTGALSVRHSEKIGPWQTEKVKSACDRCGLMCETEIHRTGNVVTDIRAVPDSIYLGNLCRKASFAHCEAEHPCSGPYQMAGRSANRMTMADIVGKLKDNRGIVFAGNGVSDEEAFLLNEITLKISGTPAVFVDENPELVSQTAFSVQPQNRPVYVAVDLSDREKFPVLDSWLRMISQKGCEIFQISSSSLPESFSSSAETPVFVMYKGMISKQFYDEIRKLTSDILLLKDTVNESGLRKAGFIGKTSQEIRRDSLEKGISLYYGYENILPAASASVWFSPVPAADYQGIIIPMHRFYDRKGSYTAAGSKKKVITGYSHKAADDKEILLEILKNL